MNKLEKVPVILMIYAGEFSLMIEGMTELNTPQVMPWSTRTTKKI